MTYPTLYILRHGQTQWNLEGRLQGRLDSPLTDLGRAQALKQRNILAPILAASDDIKVHSSPLGRAWATAEIALDGRPVTAVEGIQEVSAGSWEGRLRADIVAEHGGSAREADMFDLFLSAPDGEGAEALVARCQSYLDTLTGPTVVVSHGVVSALLRGLVRGLPMADIARLAHSQGVVSALQGGTETVLTTSEDALDFIERQLT